ncbi:maltose permease [Scheffersomyces stipitis CBS 6054]|uniref:Maltose permease n=1 Tax=Scheffersomyces stipitis (strain ATCC 58785 / CBS 6054 / NBRC 10063 / NRRL Y-11545) TaxID=322104 RepID=A3LWN3_PICST|nr:maltose permease [Scheffersomyces stipitis CBS 6054]ABN67311.2 maltose permease [Scheffersomyces stipitis CBS 6054]
MTLSEAWKDHKPAMLWSIVLGATIIMEGYDCILTSSFYAYPQFKKVFGDQIVAKDGSISYELATRWQIGLGCASTVGTMIGVFFNGYLAERFGHRMVILVSLTFMAGFLFIVFFAKTIEVLLVGQILCGIPWGIFATMGISYASEILPLQLRGYLTSIINLYWATGQFVAAGALQALVNNDTKWSYKIPYGLQWMWIPPLFIMTLLAPDSPWYLIRKGKIEQAEKSIKRLGSKRIADKSKTTLALMIHTNKLEKEQQLANLESTSGWKGYIQCFQGVNLRRTEIVCIAFAGQVLSGSTFAYSPSYFFSQAGLNSSETYKLNLGTTAIAFSGTVCSWFLLARFGRRTIYVTGFAFLVLFLFLIGVLAKPAESNGTVKWVQCGLTMLWVSTYALTIGPLAFTISAEMSATRIRSQSVCLARNSYNLVNLISYIVEPYLINPGSANLRGKTAFVWFATALPTFIWSYYRLPETRNRTYEELDLLFEKRVPARQFASYDLYSGDTSEIEKFEE